MFSIETRQPDVLKAAAIVAAAIDRLTTQLLAVEFKMDEAIAKITAEVEKQTTINASAIALIEGVIAELRQHAGEADKINELADKLAAGNAALASAVEANTAPQP
jgi:uncharacterized phage infection (PIP) family protein YhgE